jgi:hypothetical protein
MRIEYAYFDQGCRIVSEHGILGKEINANEAEEIIAEEQTRVRFTKSWAQFRPRSLTYARARSRAL